MSWPQIAMIALMAMEIGFALARNGEPKTGTTNAPAVTAGWILIASILCAGGFFDGATT